MYVFAVAVFAGFDAYRTGVTRTLCSHHNK